MDHSGDIRTDLGIEVPFYAEQAGEATLFEHAFRQRLPVLIKGPTGCGKTRFVEHMAARLGRPLITVSCHDDLSAADLSAATSSGGRDTVWQDGPLARAVRTAPSATSTRWSRPARTPPWCCTRWPTTAACCRSNAPANSWWRHAGFMLVISYNPGYQNLLKSLKPSTRQRFVAKSFDFPPPELERDIVARESGLPVQQCAALINLAARLRAMKGHDLEEGVSTRLLIYCATLIANGMPILQAAQATLVEPLSDDADVQEGLMEAVRATFGED